MARAVVRIAARSDAEASRAGNAGAAASPRGDANAGPVTPPGSTVTVDGGLAISLQAADGQKLAAHWHAGASAPGGPASRGVIVLAPATGVPQTFYLRFAQWLAGQGVDVLRFDFRGTAASRPARLRGFVADFSHWALDLDAALAHALAHAKRDARPCGPRDVCAPTQGEPPAMAPGAAHARRDATDHESVQGHRPARVSLIGHSIGGFLAPVAPNATQLHRLVLVGAQSAYWRDFPHPHRWPMATLWHGVLPAVTGVVGYFPARALRLGEDLPRGVALQWAMRPWRDPWDQPAFAHGYARALPPVHLLAADDDPFATPAAMARVARHLSATAWQTHTIARGTEGPQQIGHFGLFRSACAAQVWPRLLDLALPVEAPQGAVDPSRASPRHPH